jgi:NAD(P)-dependent dehydrogenase (short-subunit alcohol dehydrogenase family)
MSNTPRNAIIGSLIAGSAVLARSVIRTRRFYDLENKIVLITGGSRGLGLIMAREFARRGARVAICARDAAELDRAQADLTGLGTEVLTMTVDVTVQADVEDLAEAVREHLGPVDVLVNDAGVITAGPFDEMTVADYDEAMRTHFYGPLYTTMAFLPGMRERGHGRIVNISSIGGKVAVPHMLPYCASKFALTGFSEGMRAAVKRDGVYVTTVCPGLMRTGSPRHAQFKGKLESEYAWFTTADVLPGLSIDADRAGRMVVDACVYGDAELVMPMSAWLGSKANALAPGITSDVLSLSERLLPQSDGTDESDGSAGQKRAGAGISRQMIPGWLADRDDSAAARNNEALPQVAARRS